MGDRYHRSKTNSEIKAPPGVSEVPGGVTRFKILLIMPDARIHRLKIGSLINMSFREAPLTLTTLAALIPPELNADIKIIDESVDKIPWEDKYDLVGISCLTGTAPRAYEIADRFKSNGSTVVLGGVHVTLMPEEASEHAHSIVMGFAEESWPQLLRDFVNRSLKPIYNGNSSNLSGLPVPRRDLQKRRGYMSPNTVFATRGCKGTCDFCTVPAAKFGWHTRPVDEVIDEIRSIKSRRVVFNDVSLIEDREYAKELFTAMIPLKKIWGGLATSQIGYDDELLDLMHRSGCVYLLIGFESTENAALGEIRKSFNNADNYHLIMNKVHDRGIIVMGCFIFGLDHDTSSVFGNTVQIVNDLKIDIPRYAIYTPYPGTSAFKRLKDEGRIIHEHWQHYDTQHVVFRPAQMTPEQLDAGFRWAYRKTFSLGSILKRTIRSRHRMITFLGNLAYRIYIRRLHKESEKLLYA